MSRAHEVECESSAHKHCVKSWRNLVRLWKARKLCDVVINVKGRLFPCHSVVPASVSPFFRRAFSKKRESTHKKLSVEKEIVINFMTPELFNQVLHFMYTAEIQFDTQSARSLVLAAGRLEMQIMMDAIMEKILQWELEDSSSHCSNEVVKPSHNKKMSRDRSLTITRLMDELRIQGDLTTLKKIQSFAARNFNEISELPSFLETSVHTVACFLEDERVNMKEVEIFLALCNWLEAHQTHMVHAPFLLSKIRLRLLSPGELAEHVETKDYLMRKKKSRVQVLEAFRFHCLHSQSSDHSQCGSGDEMQAPKMRREITSNSGPKRKGLDGFSREATPPTDRFTLPFAYAYANILKCITVEMVA